MAPVPRFSSPSGRPDGQWGMPPLSAYTPFESLLFFQSLASHESRPSSFITISDLLRNNPYVRQNVAFNADRLAPEALEDLYTTLMRDGFDAGPNGNPSTAANPKKRKISSPRPDGLEGGYHSRVVPELVAHLYAKYKELVTREIRHEEQVYREIKDDIERLQNEEREALRRAQQPGPMDVDVKEEPPVALESKRAPLDQQQLNTQTPQHPHIPLHPPQQPTPRQHIPGGLPQQANGKPSAAPSSPAIPEASASNPLAVSAEAPHGPPSASQRAQAGPPAKHHASWPLNPSAPPTPQPSVSHANPLAKGAGKPLPSPLTRQVPQNEATAYSPAIPATPGPRPHVQSPAPVPLEGGYETPVGSASFPESRGFRPHRPSIDTSGSATPWKRNPRLSIPQSPTSPDRPRPEDVSPISDEDRSPFEPAARTREAPSRLKSRAAGDKTTRTSRDQKIPLGEEDGKPRSSRRKRDESTPSSRSRGRSALSRDDESPADSIKHEMPSTPAGLLDVEPEPRSTAGRKGGRPKRKRAPSEALEVDTQPEISRIDPSQLGQYVLSARNFPRTGAPIMNDVTMHKHASIFTKPLTERDAPGYRDLIYRPQDLKSIKSLIHQGSKAVSAATEAANTPVADGESPAPTGTPSKNAVLMLPKAEDVIPPKAVVNSAQLEKELIRMFANAVMFNPIPERGFGPAFPMTSETGSRESTQIPDDEGGIIKDTLEMFEDVEQAVTRWRAAERTADELASKSVLSLRRGSDVNTDVNE